MHRIHPANKSFLRIHLLLRRKILRLYNEWNFTFSTSFIKAIFLDNRQRIWMWSVYPPIIMGWLSRFLQIRTEVAMKFFLVWRMNERFSILGAEHYVYVVFY